MPKPIRLVALISGGGTTLQNLIDRIAAGTLDASNRRRGVEPRGCVRRRTGQAGGRFRSTSRSQHARPRLRRGSVVGGAGLHARPRLLRRLAAPAADPRRLPAPRAEHPPGAAARVRREGDVRPPRPRGGAGYGAKVSGCTVHFADDTYDTGPILVQKCVPVKEGDDPDTLAARVFEAECEAYPEAIRLIAAGRGHCGRRAGHRLELIVSSPACRRSLPVGGTSRGASAVPAGGAGGFALSALSAMSVR